MQIAIDISEKDYNRLKRKDGFDDMFLNYYGKAIVYGTPLPKGHGRLGDLDAVMDDINRSIEGMTNIGIMVDGEYLWGKLNDAIYNTTTIIEADKESEG